MKFLTKGIAMFDPNNNRNYPPQRNGFFSGRLLIAIGIAIVGLFMYFSQIETNPVTGERQHVALSPDQEIKLGLESAPEMSAQMGGEVPANDPRAVIVKKIGNYLVEHTAANGSPWKFNFHLLADTKTVNAFALPGGQIFITLGLYNRLENEGELAGVLGHEMGHVIERHSAEQMAKNQLGQWLIVAVATGASDGSQQGGNNAAVIAQMVNQMIQLRYSRKDESEADLWGVKLLSQSGYNPQALIRVMQVLKEASGGSSGGFDFFQSHPNPDLRIEQIQAYLKEHPNLVKGSYGEPLNKRSGAPAEEDNSLRSLFDLLQRSN